MIKVNLDQRSPEKQAEVIKPLEGTNQLLKMTGHSNPSYGDAQDQLAGIRAIGGFVAAYIDPKENRIVSFHEVEHATNLARNQVMVEFALGDSKNNGSSIFDRVQEHTSVAGARAWTEEEVLNQFLTKVNGLVDFWGNDAQVTTKQAACEGLAHSIMSVLDGLTLDFPQVDLVLAPHPEDKPYSIEQGENYYEPGMAFTDAADDTLGRMIYRNRKAREEKQTHAKQTQ